MNTSITSHVNFGHLDSAVYELVFDFSECLLRRNFVDYFGSYFKNEARGALIRIRTNEPRHEKTGFSPMRKQRRRSAVQ